jgi:hypothetical protein
MATRQPIKKMEDPDSGKPIPVDAPVMQAAKAARRDGQRLVIVSATEVKIVNQ